MCTCVNLLETVQTLNKYGSNISVGPILRPIQKIENTQNQSVNSENIQQPQMHTNVEQICQALQQHGDALTRSVENKIVEMEKKYHGRKPKRIAEELSVETSQWLKVRFSYDDETEKSIILTKMLTGSFQIWNLDFEGKEGEFFVVYFTYSKTAVVGEKKKLRGDYLYYCFIRAGVSFNQEVPQPIVIKVLNLFFVPRIEQNQSSLNIESVPGWQNGEFISSENFPWKKTSGMPDLVVYQKHFPYYELDQKTVTEYFAFLLQIKKPSDRVWIMLIPFLGSISSLLKAGGNPLMGFVNFVVMNEESNWTAWGQNLQVFNRDRMEISSVDVSSKELEELACNVKDETFIVDATFSEEDTEYTKKKLLDNVRKFAKLFNGRAGIRTTKNKIHDALLISFSSQQILECSAQNIFMDTNFAEPDVDVLTFVESHAVEAILTAWIQFITRNYNDIKVIIRKQRVKEKGWGRILEIIQELVSAFWTAEGIELEKELHLPDDFKFSDILKESIHGDELLDSFKCGSRKVTKEFLMLQKGRYQHAEEDAIYFDDEYIYFVTATFKKFLRRQGLERYQAELLLELKKNGQLKTDKEGYSRKVTICGDRKEAYCINKKVFDEADGINFTKLGGKHNER